MPKIDIEVLANRTIEDVMERLEKSKEELAELTPKEFVEAWAGWNIGDPYWATIMIDMYEELKATEAE